MVIVALFLVGVGLGLPLVMLSALAWAGTVSDRVDQEKD